MRVAVVVNNHSAAARRRELPATIRELFQQRNIEATLSICRGQDIPAVLAATVKARPDALVAGGGDGTISAAAAICCQSGLPLGVLTLGTMNHFARDLKLSQSLEGAIESIAAGRTMHVDLGCVNGHTFINNSSLGAYPRAVEEREHLRDRLRLRKYVAALFAFLHVFASRPMLAVSMELDGQALNITTPFVFVGNNRYNVRLFSIQLRQSLTQQQLCVYTARHGGLGGLAKLLFLACCHRLEQSRDFEMRFGSELIIHLDRRTIRVSKDGEVLRLKPPLRYGILPAALEVFVP